MLPSSEDDDKRIIESIKKQKMERNQTLLRSNPITEAFQ